MDGLYFSLCPFKYRAPVGIQSCCNNNGNIHPPHPPHNPVHTLIIITVSLGARFLLVLELLWFPSPWSADKNPLIRRDVCNCAHVIFPHAILTFTPAGSHVWHIWIQKVAVHSEHICGLGALSVWTSEWPGGWTLCDFTTAPRGTRLISDHWWVVSYWIWK